jgi:hypothetical protein
MQRTTCNGNQAAHDMQRRICSARHAAHGLRTARGAAAIVVCYVTLPVIPHQGQLRAMSWRCSSDVVCCMLSVACCLLHAVLFAVRCRNNALCEVLAVLVRQRLPRRDDLQQTRAHARAKYRRYAARHAAHAHASNESSRTRGRAVPPSTFPSDPFATLAARADGRGWARGGGPSPGADVVGVSPVPAQMWSGGAQSRCRCGRGEPSPSADVQPRPSRAHANSAGGEPSPGADVGGVSPVPMQMRSGAGPDPVQMWQR